LLLLIVISDSVNVESMTIT